jgi:hypothetical protein
LRGFDQASASSPTFGLWATGGTPVGVSFAFRATPALALIADGGIVFTYLVYLGSALVFAHKHCDACAPAQ